MESDRIFFRRFVTTAFFRHDVQELRTFQVAHVLERGDQPQHVVPINRANIVKAQLFKECARHDHAFDVFFGALEQLFDWRYAREDFLAAFAQRGVKLAGEQLCQMVIQRADVLGNRHFVIVQDNQHVRLDIARVVHGLKGHPGGDGAVADHADGAALLVLFFGGHGNTDTRRDGGGGVADA